VTRLDFAYHDRPDYVMTSKRASGILLHPTSLPGRFAVGDLGPAAYRFANFLEASGQSLWQVLPLGPTGYGDSPYAGYSAFAGNTLLISPEKLFDDGWLSQSDLDEFQTVASDRVDFGRAHQIKDALMAKAFARYRSSSGATLKNDFESFIKENSYWLDDYALFRALKSEHDGRAWHEWERSLASRDSAALARAAAELRDKTEAHKFAQFLFFRQWFELKSYCNDRQIKLIGDVPIFVAHDSADVWTHRSQFKLDERGMPTVVAGVPPDYFSATGQFWGNPLYDWERMAAGGFEWWRERVRASLRMVDIIRLDHFRGFAASWEIPAGDTTAERGRWVEVPGRELFNVIRDALGDVSIIAEDLGVITPDVEKLRDDFDFPGMRVLQFAFSSDQDNIDLPHNYHRNVVVYTGTHDNDTTVGWFRSIAGAGSTRTAEQIAAERNFCLKYLHTDGSEIHWDFIRAAFASVADTAIVPLQDLLGLGSAARMNLPNSTEGNWLWRFGEKDLTDDLAARLREVTEIYGRMP
jgi:4-alpha-glucanotransferase